MGLYCEAGVLGQIGCKWLSFGLALPTFFNNNNNINNNINEYIINGNIKKCYVYFNNSIFSRAFSLLILVRMFLVFRFL